MVGMLDYLHVATGSVNTRHQVLWSTERSALCWSVLSSALLSAALLDPINIFYPTLPDLLNCHLLVFPQLDQSLSS